jgi:hypothetical protein
MKFQMPNFNALLDIAIKVKAKKKKKKEEEKLRKKLRSNQIHILNFYNSKTP